MPIAQTHDLTEKLGIENEIALKVDPKLALAEVKVRRWIGDTLYDELEDLTDTADADYPDKLAVIHAECLLAYAEALPMLNMRLTETGGLVRSVGFNESRQSLMSRRELHDYQKDFTGQAQTLLRHLLLASNGVWAL